MIKQKNLRCQTKSAFPNTLGIVNTTCFLFVFFFCVSLGSHVSNSTEVTYRLSFSTTFSLIKFYKNQVS